MRLKNAARLFDTCPVYDGYSGASLFKIQTSTFLESAVEGSTSSRRVISLAPNLVPPGHSVVLVLNDLWIVGASNVDEWKGEAIRKAYWTKKVTDNFRLLTPAEACLNAPGIATYGSKKYFKDSTNTQTDSELDPTWEIALSASSAAGRGSFLKSGNTFYRVRVSYVDVDGFKTCQSDEVDQDFVTVEFKTSNSYDPISDSYVPSTVNTNGILLDYAKAFTKQQITDYKFEAGDLCLLVPQSAATPAVGQTVSLSSAGRYSGDWRTLAVQLEQDAFNLHIRKQ